jgi:transglutaminase-like putative cysteine protease
MHADISYQTTFRYSNRVAESQNEVRACPATDADQQLLAYRIDASPRARILRYVDAWGTQVDAFGVRAVHDELVVSVQASVQTQARHTPQMALPVTVVDTAGFTDAHWEFLQPTRHTTTSAEVAAIARRCVDTSGDDLVAAVWCMATWVNTELTYAPGATTIGVTTDEVLTRRSGVCQDFSHLLVALCRSVGIPARYVSGYFFAANEAAPLSDDEVHTVEVQTHAWAEVALPGVGWWAIDPTNLAPVGEHHITIGRGRDYDDVAPFRGMYTGDADAEVTATVTIRRLDSPHQPAYTSAEVLQSFPVGVTTAANRPHASDQ